ncbi:MAG TPA: SGNH/GDSL hydrolase family protein [Fimbriiglobus sp.]|nr:SGNH/GDSL hydrolase family protein [Fimbriiglobus sp.]
MPRLLPALVLLLTAASVRAADPPADFFFKPNDRIVFLGDSITEQFQYSTYLELYLTTRFPKANFTFLNAGISGDTAHGGAGRFQAHVLADKPTAVTINFGMNDAGYGEFRPDAAKRYVEKTAAMLDAAKKAGVRVALMSPNAVDWRVNDKFKLYVETQKRFYAPLKALAQEEGVPFVDQYAATRAAIEKLAQDDPKAAKVRPFPDGVHTAPAGALLMAHTILVGLKAPAAVSGVDVDAKTGETDTAGCRVDDLTATPYGVAFTRTDEALPMPMQKDWLPVLPYTDELTDLNWYGLKVTGLRDGDYAVVIDGVEVGKVPAKKLAAGVNLGNVSYGPVFDQANKVLAAINAKNQIVHQRFRGVTLFNLPSWLGDLRQSVDERKAKERARLMPKIEAAQIEVYKLAQPKPHKFEVRAVK